MVNVTEDQARKIASIATELARIDGVIPRVQAAIDGKLNVKEPGATAVDINNGEERISLPSMLSGDMAASFWATWLSQLQTQRAAMVAMLSNVE